MEKKEGIKIIKKNIKYNAQQEEYILKIKKKCTKCWWLLLLLLPLLLLIPITKTVYIQVIDADTKNTINDISVYFEYEKQSFRTSGNPTFSFIRKSNELGVVEFYKIRYKLYSYLLKFQSKTKIYANNKCFASNELEHNFHSIGDNDTLLLAINPTLIDLRIKVIDSLTTLPIKNANVQLKYIKDDNFLIDSSITDENGIVTFEKVPKCSMFEFIKGIAQNYLPDSILNGKNENISTILPEQILRLKSNLLKIDFKVTQCYNPGRPLYDFYIDDVLIERIKTTSGDTKISGKDGKSGQFVPFEKYLTSGKHIFKFVLAEEHGNSTCSGCTQLVFPELNLYFPLYHKKENVFEVIIPKK